MGVCVKTAWATSRPQEKRFFGISRERDKRSSHARRQFCDPRTYGKNSKIRPSPEASKIDLPKLGSKTGESQTVYTNFAPLHHRLLPGCCSVLRSHLYYENQGSIGVTEKKGSRMESALKIWLPHTHTMLPPYSFFFAAEGDS